MGNATAQNTQLIDQAALVIQIPGEEEIEDLRISAIAVTSDAGTENVSTPNRVAGYFNSPGGQTLSFTSNEPVDLSSPKWQEISDNKTEFVTTVFDTKTVNGDEIPLTSQRYLGCRAVVNTTHDSPKQYDVTITATSREPRVDLVSQA